VSEIPQLAAGGWLMADTDYKLDWRASLRGRLGYAYDRYLIYGTGGVAFLKEDQVRTQYQPVDSTRPWGNSTELFKESASGIRVGWTGGAGFEYALTSNWSLRGEYQFTGFGIEKFIFPKARRGMTQARQELIGYDPPQPLPPWPFPNIPDPRPAPEPTPIYETIPGTFDSTNGRSAANELDLHAINFGLNYRF
jgi:hemoglobin/transferrin/lactoferrin receptor protein